MTGDPRERGPDELSAVVPPGVVTRCVRGTEVEGHLYPDELAHTGRFTRRRMTEFRTTRCLAREALRALGAAPGSVPVGPGGAPVWPDGVVGSMTHCAGFRGVAVARAGQLAGIGLDAEPHVALTAGVRRRVLSAVEEDMTRALATGCDAVAWDVVVFSAKESVQKLTWSTSGTMPGLRQVAVELSADGRFRARVLAGAGHAGDPSAAGTSSVGAWSVVDGVVVTAAHAGRRSPQVA